MSIVIKNLIPSLVEDGVFGEFQFVDLKENDQTEKGTQFASSLLFLNLVVEGSSGKKVLPLVVKLHTKESEDFFNNEVMFYNEVNMYKEILPALGYEENKFPKMYYGTATMGRNPGDDIVILENLKYKGFVPSKHKIFLDFNHLSLAIKKIAEFHSLSFKLKNENKEKFDQLLSMLKEIEGNELVEQESEIVNAVSLKRGVEAALEKSTSTDQLKRCLKLFESSRKLFKLIKHPEEPFSVICHGDFCNNNILFKYSETGELEDCVLFDFQVSLYSSPAVDLMFFLYMHTTSDIREKYWDEILMLYWDTLRKNVPTSMPSFQEFIEHIEKRAVYGYLISGWFLPLMLIQGDNTMIGLEEFNKMSTEEKVELVRTLGGEKAEEKICDIILHLLKKNYIQKFLDFCDEKGMQC